MSQCFVVFRNFRIFVNADREKTGKPRVLDDQRWEGGGLRGSIDRSLIGEG